LSWIVEIKSIARDPGERTKIAVWSKDEKVDCVGACVGMRGARVKNIVNELHNEKIDIVRWSDEFHNYISGALSPAKISEIKIDKQNKTASVIVDDDQLSLAIGKRGQNVRLASRLTGYAIDIRTKAMLAEAVLGGSKVKPQVEKDKFSLSELSGVGKKTADNLKQAGFKDIKAIASTSIEELIKVQGLGKKTATKLIKQAKKIRPLL
jgi:transcription termination/antitermination protein NusA